MLDRTAVLPRVAAAVSSGVDWVQLRERELEGAALLELADRVTQTVREAGSRARRPVRVLVNRRLDVALAAGADGVHLGFDAVAPASARALLGAGALIGASCHAPDEVEAAEGADYAHLAPIFTPLSKQGTRAPLGPQALGRVGRSRPVLAQGGIEAKNAAACIEAGAAGVAVTGAILGARNPGLAAAALRRVLDAAASRAPALAWLLALCGLLPLGLLLAAGPARASGYDELEERIIEIADRVQPSVVHIEAIVRVNDRRNQVTGSGVLASKEGRILTNQHVVHKAEKVTVSVPGHKKKYPARILGTDVQTDIAVLEIEGGPFPAATFGRADQVRVGQWVLAIGNPYGLDGTVSFGIVSAKGRDLELPETLNDFIQTDAMIDRGSSGGPLVDLEGRVIGINSRGQGRGIGFTIPIDTALEVAREIEKGGIQRGYLGITLQPLDRDLAEYFGQPSLAGTVVNSVLEESPAQAAGLRVGDIITRFNGTPIETENEEDLGSFQRLVAAVDPGTKVELEIVRSGQKQEIEAVIAAQPSLDPDEEESDVGFHVREITRNLARAHRLDTERGAFVHFVARGSPASEAGLYVGDVIERIEDRPVGDLAEFRDAMYRVAGKERFLITARRGDETKFLLVKRGAHEALPAGSGPDVDPAALPGQPPPAN